MDKFYQFYVIVDKYGDVAEFKNAVCETVQFYCD